MTRWLLAIIALAATVASAGRLTTFAWDNGTDWPAGTTVELCSNGVCATGLTSTNHTLDVPINPGEKYDAKARAVAPAGYQCGDPSAPCPYSDWYALEQTWSKDPINPWAIKQEITQMAVTYSSVSIIADTDQDSSVSASVPSGLSSGDLWLVVMEVDTNYNASNTISVPSGWTAVSTGSHAGTAWPFARAFYKIAGSSEITQTFTLSIPGGVYHVYGASVRITGVDTTTPISATAFTNSSAIPPSRTVASDGSLAIVWGAAAADPGTITLPSGYTSINIQNADYAIYAIAYKSVNSGTETPGAFSFSNASANFTETIITQPSGGGAAATALPRRALDGPFYGATRGSAR